MEGMFSILYSNYIMPDLITKFNYLSFYDVPKISKGTLCVNDKRREDNLIRGIPLVASLSILKSGFGVNTYIKKANATFKIRQGMVHGFKVAMNKTIAFNFLQDFFFILPIELSTIGVTPTIGVAKTGTATFSVQNIKLHPFFNNTLVAYTSTSFGASFSIALSPVQSLSKNTVLLSGFSFLLC